jgi:hypothetical protein
MCRAIDAAYEVDEVSQIRDKARAIELYMKLKHNTEAELRCCQIRLRAERKLGELLREMEKAKGARGNPGGRGAPIVRSNGATAQTLAELGITKNQSTNWQKLAAVPQNQFEAALAGPEKPTLNRIISAAAPPPDAAECGDDLLDHPISEIFLLRITAHVGEGQHRDRGLKAPLRCRPRNSAGPLHGNQTARHASDRERPGSSRRPAGARSADDAPQGRRSSPDKS